jgi:hypothetical protein
MGAWGNGLFEGDASADVLAIFEDAIADGATVDEASRRVLTEMGAAIYDFDDGPEIAIALAALQLQHSALSEESRIRVLSAIDSDLRRWEGAARTREHYDGRKAVLDDFRQALLKS